MGITKITLDDLREMTDREGLILRGCGGDAQEWLNGINELLTEEGILQNGDTFKNVLSFEHDGHTNLLFDMDGVGLEIGRLAMWRIASRDTFGGVWLSDYRVNQLGMTEQTADETPEQRPKPECPIIGADGNIFSLVGIASRTLKRAGQHNAAAEMWERVQECNGYDAALAVLMDYVEPVSAEPDWEL